MMPVCKKSREVDSLHCSEHSELELRSLSDEAPLNSWSEFTDISPKRDIEINCDAKHVECLTSLHQAAEVKPRALLTPSFAVAARFMMIK